MYGHRPLLKPEFPVGRPPSSRTSRIESAPEGVQCLAQNLGFPQATLKIEMRGRTYYAHDHGAAFTHDPVPNNPAKSFDIMQVIDGTDPAKPFHTKPEDNSDLALLAASVEKWKIVNTPYVQPVAALEA